MRDLLKTDAIPKFFIGYFWRSDKRNPTPKMIFKIFLSLAMCLLLASPSIAKKTEVEVDEGSLLYNLVDEDMKDVGLDDPEPYEPEKPAKETQKGDCSPAARRNTDEYVDKVLSEVRPKLPEPAFLPERVGRFKLFNGTLTNLITLQRSGPAMVRCTDDEFSFLVPVSLSNLTGRYYWETDNGVPVFRGLIDMLIGSVDADILYTRTFSPREGEPKARVDKLTITRLQGVKVQFDGLGPLNVVASRFTNLVARFFSRGVSRALEGPVRNAINRELENVEKYELYYY